MSGPFSSAHARFVVVLLSFHIPICIIKKPEGKMPYDDEDYIDVGYEMKIYTNWNLLKCIFYELFLIGILQLLIKDN